jgi:hypothetical protein
MTSANLPVATGGAVSALVGSADERAGQRLLEFFASAIRNPRTRRAYARAAGIFSGGGRDLDHGDTAATRGCMDRTADAAVLGADRMRLASTFSPFECICPLMSGVRSWQSRSRDSRTLNQLD